MRQFVMNIIDAIWIRKQARENPLVVSPGPGKVDAIHHLLHLGYGSLVLTLSVGLHVLITNHIKNHRAVWWTGGQIETNYAGIFPIFAHGQACKVELGILEDGTAVYRIVP